MYWASSSDTGIWERLTKKLLYPRENSHSEMKALKYSSSGRETERWRLNQEGVMHQDRNLREEKRSQVTKNTMSHVENSGLFLNTNMKKKWIVVSNRIQSISFCKMILKKKKEG